MSVPASSVAHGSGARADLHTLLSRAWSLDRRRLTAVANAGVLNGLIGGGSLLLLAPIVSTVIRPTSTSVRLGRWSVGTPSHLATLSLLLVAYVALAAGQAALTRAIAIAGQSLQLRLQDALRQEAFDALLAARWSFLIQRRRSDILEVVTTGAQRSGTAFQQCLAFGATAVLAVVTAVVAVVVAPALGLVAILAVSGLAALLASSTVRPARRLGMDFGLRNRQLHAVVGGSLDSLRLVKAHDSVETWSSQVAQSFAENRRVLMATTRQSSNVAAVSAVGFAAAAAAMVLVAVALGVAPASIVVMLLLVARLGGQARGLTQSASLVASALPAVADLAALTASATAEREFPRATGPPVAPSPVDPAAPLLVMSAVCFRYPAAKTGVARIDLRVPRGEITVLTGTSGSGKSTTADLALGLISPTSGRVLVDGHGLTSDVLRWWRSQVAYVPQETVLLAGTLRENLAWSAGHPVTDEECWEALDRAAAGFASSLPDGLEVQLGDRGLRLSGGERQRIALARALLRRPRLLVLDEATSSLDDATEAAVAETVRSLVPSLTVLMIAHRQSTIDSADHVVRIEDGRTVGTMT